MVFEQALIQKLEKAYLLESLHDDYTTISEKQVRLEKKNKKGGFDEKLYLVEVEE